MATFGVVLPKVKSKTFTLHF